MSYIPKSVDVLNTEINDFVSSMKSLNYNKVIKYVRKLVNPLNITMRYENPKQAKENFRIIFYADRNRSSFNNALVRACNGLIINIRDQESTVCCLPVEGFYPKVWKLWRKFMGGFR